MLKKARIAIILTSVFFCFGFSNQIKAASLEERVCNRLINNFSNNQKMWDRVNERINKNLGFYCQPIVVRVDISKPSSTNVKAKSDAHHDLFKDAFNKKSDEYAILSWLSTLYEGNAYQRISSILNEMSKDIKILEINASNSALRSLTIDEYKNVHLVLIRINENISLVSGIITTSHISIQKVQPLLLKRKSLTNSCDKDRQFLESLELNNPVFKKVILYERGCLTKVQLCKEDYIKNEDICSD